MESPASRVFDFLLGRAKSATLHEIVEGTQVPPSSAHRILNALVREGRVERFGRQQTATYSPRERFSAQSTIRYSGNRLGERHEWLHFEWTVHDGVDWRFPLVTRVRDSRARATLSRLLNALWEQGEFTPWLTAGDIGSSPEFSDSEKARISKLVRDPRHYEGVTFVVFGSCARGDARKDSDIDLLVLTPPDIKENEPLHPHERNIRHVIDTINLGSSRSIDVLFATREDFWGRMPPGLQTAILADGITIYSTVRGFEFIEGAAAVLKARAGDDVRE